MLRFLIALLMFPVFASAQHRQLVVTADLPCPHTRAWQLWSTVPGITSFLGQDARIDPVVGGAYEVYFLMDNEPGMRGSEGCRITKWEPNKRLGFTWNAPPDFGPLRQQHTEVFIVFDSTGPFTSRITLGQVGWKEGEDWDKLYQYFDRAWNHVMKHLQNMLAAEYEEKLNWMLGSWQMADNPGVIEHWSNPETIGFSGTSMKISGKDTTLLENLAIEMLPTGVRYMADVQSGRQKSQGPVSFELVDLTEGSVRFRNADHDYPQEISYQLTREGLIATLSLLDGKKATEIRFTRVN